PRHRARPAGSARTRRPAPTLPSARARAGGIAACPSWRSRPQGDGSAPPGGLARCRAWNAGSASLPSEQPRQRFVEPLALLARRLAERLGGRVHELVGKAVREHLEHLRRVFAALELRKRALELVSSCRV